MIAGCRAGSGPPVLLLHGGPGLGFGYLRDLADELAQENDVAWYQQRGLEPSAVEGPYSVAADVGDARRVLDALGWEKAYVVGHSWGGHLALHVAEAMPDGSSACSPSIRSARSATDAGRSSTRRCSAARPRSRASGRASSTSCSMAGKADDELALEGMRLVWPAYFADPETAPPMPELRMAIERAGEMMPSIMAELPALEAGLPGIRVPVGFVHGSRSPMPLAASTDAAGADSRRVGGGRRGRGAFRLVRGARRRSRGAAAAHRRLTVAGVLAASIPCASMYCTSSYGACTSTRTSSRPRRRRSCSRSSRTVRATATRSSSACASSRRASSSGPTGCSIPLLHRLGRLGHVTTEWRTPPEGRRRKYYGITDDGRAALAEQQRQWADRHARAQRRLARARVPLLTAIRET